MEHNTATASARSGDKHEDKTAGAATQASQQAVRGSAEQTARVADAATKVGEHAVRAGAGIAQKNAETVQLALQSGAEFAARTTKRSADHMSRVLGVAGEDVKKAAEKSTDNIEAIAQSGVVMAEIGRRLCGEWAEFARDHMERTFDRMDALMRCQNPQEFAAAQSDLVRENVDGFIDYARRVGEHYVWMANEADKKVDETQAQRGPAGR